MPLKDYERRVDNKEMPSKIVITHPRDAIAADTTTIKWNGSKWIREGYFVCDENLAPPPDFTHPHDLEREHYEILLSEYGLTLEDVDEEKLPSLSPAELAAIARKKTIGSGPEPSNEVMKMEPKDRIIVALDVDEIGKAMQLAQTLKEHVGMFKVGLEFIWSCLERFASLPHEEAHKELDWFRSFFEENGSKLFIDAKLKDIKNTIASAVRPITKLNVAMLNIHCLGTSRQAMQAAVGTATEFADNLLHRPKILGVTVLTDVDYDDLISAGIFPRLQNEHFRSWKDMEMVKKEEMQRLVRRLAEMAQSAGLDGVIASAQEARMIKEYCSDNFLVVTPGIRPEWAKTDDQKRITTPADAIRAGADYLVIGRAIRTPPEEIGGPVEAAKLIAEEIAQAV